jgi:CheY-like chemotaxis protein
MMLMFDGHQVETASSGYEALAKFDPARFDLVVTDYAMPGMKGDQLAQAIKKKSPQTPVILLTAFPPDAQPACFNLVITKPFAFEDLRSALAKVDDWSQ